MEVDCGDSLRLQVVYYTTAGIWACFMLFFICCICLSPNDYYRALQKLFASALMLKTTSHVFTGLLHSLCPIDSETHTYFTTVVASCDVLHYSLAILGMILVSKGFCISRQFLGTIDEATIAGVMAAVSVCFSLYLISTALVGLFIVLACVLCVYTSEFTLETLETLRRAWLVQYDCGLPELMRATYVKMRLMRIFFYLQILNYASMVLTTSNWVGFWLWFIPAESDFLKVLTVAEEVLETVAFLSICLAISSKGRKHLVLSRWDFFSEEEIRPIPKLYAVLHPQEINSESELSQQLVVVLTPGAFDEDYPYAQCTIGVSEDLESISDK